MKIGNAPLPIADRAPADRMIQRVKGDREKEGRQEPAAASEAFEVQLSRTSGAVGASTPVSGDEASRSARETREMIAQNNREAAFTHGTLDPKKLLDLLA